MSITELGKILTASKIIYENKRDHAIEQLSIIQKMIGATVTLSNLLEKMDTHCDNQRKELRYQEKRILNQKETIIEYTKLLESTRMNRDMRSSFIEKHGLEDEWNKMIRGTARKGSA